MAELKTECIKRLIVRYIQEENLKAGDRLPTQDFFRRHFNCGMTTVSSAISELKQFGVLDVRDKRGIFVIDPRNGGFAGRTIGITMCAAEDSAYYSCLSCALQRILAQNGFHVELFYLRAGGTGNGGFYQREDFPGLIRYAESGLLDGVIHLDDFSETTIKWLHAQGVPTLFVGAVPKADACVTYSFYELLERVCSRIQSEGGKNPILVIPSMIELDLKPLFRKAFGENALFHILEEDGSGVSAAREYLAIPEEKRPDWIVCFDDTVALAMSSVLSCCLPKEKLPRAAFLTSENFKFVFPLPDILLYTIDLNRFAMLACRTMMDAIRENKSVAGRTVFRPEERFILSKWDGKEYRRMEICGKKKKDSNTGISSGTHP